MSRPRRTVAFLLVIGIVGVALLVAGQSVFLESFKAREPAPPPPAQDPAGGVSGRVRFADGSAAAGVSVSVVTGAERGSTTNQLATDAAGGFALAAEDLGEGAGVQLVVARSGPLQVRAGEPPWDLVFPATFEIGGMVVAAADRSEVVGATVRCAGRTGTSAEGGAFTIADLPAAAAAKLPLVLEIGATGYRDQRKQLPPDWLPGRYSDVTVLLEPDR